MTELVRTERLTRRYVMGETVLSALDGISLTFETGEIAAIIGRSGSGKSTLLQLLGGLDRPTSGEVFVRGKRLAESSEDELALYRRQDVGFIFQFFNLVPTLTAQQNVELPLTLAGVSRSGGGRRSCSTAPASPAAASTAPASSPAASSSASRSPARSSTIPRCSWPTSRPATSIRRRPPRSSASWAPWARRSSS
jgi:ABC-type sugar transport system ATPase subunit